LFNKKNQKYDVIKRFFISGREYCRVKFTATRHEDVIPADRVKTGDFEDMSLVESLAEVKQLVVKVPEEKKEELKELIEKAKEEPAIIFPAEEPKVEVVNADKIIATNPKGEEIEVLDLESFCAENKLDYEVVQAVLEGKQKTHRKWRFKRA
jgi:hypothetical protein